MSLTEAVASGDRVAALEAIRDRLAAELDAVEGRDAATVAKELRAVLDALNASEGGKGKESSSDDLAARRETKRAAAGLQPPPVRLLVRRRRD